MDKTRVKIFRMIMLAMMVAIGVVISPILRIEGMCPTAHLVNIVCSVLMGPWYSLLCATMIGVIRMMFMGIPTDRLETVAQGLTELSLKAIPHSRMKIYVPPIM